MVTLDQWTEVLKSCEGIPYARQGLTRDGCDCVGLILLAAKELGFDYTQLCFGPNQAKLSALMELSTNISDPDIGCLVIFNRGGWAPHRHCGIRLSLDYLINSNAEADKVILLSWKLVYERRTKFSYYRLPFICP